MCQDNLSSIINDGYNLIVMNLRSELELPKSKLATLTYNTGGTEIRAELLF